MRKSWVSFVGALAMGWSATAQAQGPAPVPMPTPLPAPAPVIATPGPAPQLSLANPAASPAPIVTPAPVSAAPAPIKASAPIASSSCGGGQCFNGCGILSGLLSHAVLPCGEWYAGAGVYYMKPVFENNPAFSALGAGGLTTTVTNLSYDYEVAPLAFIGWTGASGFGVRGRWFLFDGDGEATIAGVTAGTIIGPNGTALATADGAVASSNLKTNVFDIEGTYAFNAGNWSLLTSAGVRYVHMSQDYSLQGFVGAAPVAAELLTASHNFNGIGPTFSIEGRRPIFNSAWALYGNLRASIVAGDTNQNAFDGATLLTASGTSLLTIGEVEVGGLWSKPCGRFGLTAQLGFVGQAWINGGNASQGLGGGGAASGLSSGNFGFIGGVARLGVNF